MDGERLEIPNSKPEENDRKTYAEIFDDLCPVYMSYGMTYEQYWDGDSEMCRFYRKAFQEKLKQQNAMLHLQGAYIYEALCDVSPLYREFSKGDHSPKKYRAEPYELFNKQGNDEAETNVDEEKKEFDKGLESMFAWAQAVNSKNQ